MVEISAPSAFVFLVCIATYFIVTCAEISDFQDDINIIPDRNIDQQSESDYTFSDLLENQRFAYGLRRLFENFGHQRIEKRNCHIGAGLSSKCDNNDLINSLKYEQYLKTARSPGRRRR